MTSTTSNNKENYYVKVEDKDFDKAKIEIKKVIDEGYDNDILSKDEHEALYPEGKKPGKFYCTFKVHKNHIPGRPPPVRPIVSCSGSITENIGSYVEHHLKDLANKHNSYLKDTPDFLRVIENINQN